VTRPQDFDALVSFVMARYDASQERAETIVTNHADAVRAEMEQAKKTVVVKRRIEDRPAREETPAEEKAREAAEEAEEDAEDVQP
jgi:hypothetical protein